AGAAAGRRVPRRAGAGGRRGGWRRGRPAADVAKRPRAGVTRPVRERAFPYWRGVDKKLGDRIATRVESA
ncbi:hypothetical protein, partial [Streptomyces palmae]|uniref:hypothetical protein n=1 Tax=Streptomyces palmae TaxID=1701085 RepID=UPI001432896D